MKHCITFFLLAAITSLAYGQRGTIRGNVYDKETSQPVAFANVILAGTTIGTNTDEAGFYTLSGVPNGTYRLTVSFIGYDSTSVEVVIKNNIIYQKFYISESGFKLQTVDISARKERAKSEVQISKISVTPKQIKSLPSVGGEADIAQYLPVLPGVIFSGDQGGQLYIRGGAPIQNKVLLDGMTIYNPFHSIGFFSVFETETIRNIDVMTGGFNAEYGGRISAVLDIKTRDGNKKRLSGLVSVNPFQSKILLEGPIVPLTREDGGSVSFIVTGKQSYIDQTSKSLYSYTKNYNLQDSAGLPFTFRDFYGKVTFEAPNGSRLSVFGFDYTDKVDYFGVAKFDWAQFGGGANFSLIPSSTGTVIGGFVAYSKYQINLKESDESPRYSEIGGFNVGLNFTNYGTTSETKYGFEINGFNTDFRFRNFLGYTFEQQENTTEMSGFVKFKRKFRNLVLEPSLRVQYYASLGVTSFEPRLGAKINVTDKLRLKFAGGVYSQNLISTVNERDIVNLFVGFLSGPEEPVFVQNTKKDAQSRLQRSIHAIGGMEIDLTKRLELNIEPYFKRFSQLININRNKLEVTDANYITETGNASGLDFSLRYDDSRLYLWFTYSLGYVNRDDGVQVYPTVFDRRHNINFLGTYNWGKNKSWEFSARWNMGSGFPFTKTQGFYTKYNFEKGVTTDVLTKNGDELGVIYSNTRNGGRLPYYHRLDISLKKSFFFSKTSRLDLVASVTNAYDRQNIFYFDRIRYKRVDQLPIIPSMGVTFSF